MDLFKSLLDQVQSQATQPEMPGIVLSIILSSISSIVLFLLYEWFYRYKETGSQIHRSFFLIGPATTGIFIAIQFSLPLSLGLLGALSFIRFRTPVKDPEEVGYMMVLIALSICSATFNYTIVLVLLAVVICMLIIKENYIAERITGHGTGYLLVAARPEEMNESLIISTLSEFVRNAKILSINSGNGLTHYQYSFKDSGPIRRDEMLKTLNDIAGVEQLDISFSQRPI